MKVMQFKQMVVTAVCVLFLLKLKWPKSKNFYEYKLCVNAMDTDMKNFGIWNGTLKQSTRSNRGCAAELSLDF